MRFSGITLDGHDLGRLADFWTAALGYDREPESGVYLTLRSPSGDSPSIFLQRVPEVKTVKNRVHLDLGSGQGLEQMKREVERLTALGGRKITVVQEGGGTWTVMADPEDNEFCVLS